MSSADCCSDTDTRDIEQAQMSDSYWKDQLHTMLKRTDSDSEVSDSEHFLTKGAFLLTPSHGLSMDKAAAILDKMHFKGCFSLTKTATGILFRFSDVEDYQMVYKKGFLKVTGSRFYRKIAIPCRPQKTFSVLVWDVPDEVPEEDVRHALYKFNSVVEVVRLHPGRAHSPTHNAGSSTPKASGERARATPDGELTSGLIPRAGGGVIRVTLASLDETNLLLHNGLDFYGATFFPTELASPPRAAALLRHNKVVGGSMSARVRDLLPVFDNAAFAKFAPPTSKTLKPRK